MGLLDKLSGFETNVKTEASKPDIKSQKEKSNSVGLLKRTMLLTTRNRLDFFEFVQKYNFSHCAVFSNINNEFVISDSFGFDTTSILNSISTLDFWKGTVTETNKWLFINNEKLSPFYQFFSAEFKDYFKSLYIYVIEDKNIISRILMICSNDSTQKEFNDEIIADFKVLLPELNTKSDYSNDDLHDNKIYSYKLEFNEFLSSILNSTDKSLKYDLLKHSIQNELFFLIKKAFPEPNIILFDNSCINLYLVLPENLEEELLLQHLINYLNSFAGDNSQLITIEYSGLIDSVTQIK